MFHLIYAERSDLKLSSIEFILESHTRAYWCNILCYIYISMYIQVKHFLSHCSTQS